MWRDDVVLALRSLGGEAHLSDIYEAVRKNREGVFPNSWQAIIRRELEHNSSNSASYQNRYDLFYSTHGIGRGRWGLRDAGTPKATDLDDAAPERSLIQTYRILRDTALARALKAARDHTCQICGDRIGPPGGEGYSEAHHIRPLGRPHNGPDISENIVILCPNHHAMLDLGMMPLTLEMFPKHRTHEIHIDYINYHNTTIYPQSRHKLI